VTSGKQLFSVSSFVNSIGLNLFFISLFYGFIFLINGLPAVFNPDFLLCFKLILHMNLAKHYREFKIKIETGVNLSVTQG
jgi:hypothetical protein